MTLKGDPFGIGERWMQAIETIGCAGAEAFSKAAAEKLYGPTGEVLARKTEELVKVPQDLNTAMATATANTMAQSLGWWAQANPMLNPKNNPYMALWFPPKTEPAQDHEPEL